MRAAARSTSPTPSSFLPLRRVTSLLGSHLPRFPPQHRLLPRQAPVIARERAALAECAVARDHEGDRVLADGGADGAGGFGGLQAVGDVGVADGAAHRDLEQGLPHPHLEIGADQDDAQGLVGAPQRLVEDALRQRRGPGDILDRGGARPAALHV